MTLGFAIIVRNAAPALWSCLLRLRQVTRADDKIVVLDTGSQDDTPLLIRRFAAELGWGDGVSAELIFSDDMARARQDALALAQARLETEWVLPLMADDLPCPDGIAALRQSLDQTDATPDLVVLGRAHALAGPGARVAATDQARWPASLPQDAAGARRTVLRLAPDPRRFLLSGAFQTRSGLAPRLADDPDADQTYCDRLVATAETFLLCPEPYVLTPLPAFEDGAQAIAAVSVPPASETALIRALDQVADSLGTLPPEVALDFLQRLDAVFRSWPRAMRRAAMASPEPASALLARLYKGGPDAALPHLLMRLMARDRAHQAALTAALARQRLDLDLALPGADALHDMFERARQP